VKRAYFDVYVGISGDMILGSLVDVGLPLGLLQDTVAALGLGDEIQLSSRTVRKGALTGTKVEVTCQETHHHRHLSDILAMIGDAALPEHVKEQAAAVFTRLGEAEAGVHGYALEDVHFHEVGALDAVVDIVGAVAGLHALGIARVDVSPIPISRGWANTAHGRLPLPAPATAALLAGVLVCGQDLNVETVTPTGAAILATLAASFGPVPAMQLERVGYGAGTMDLDLPNMVRLLVGASSEAETGLQLETMSVLSTNIDDMPGEWFGPLFDDLLAHGASDVWFTPIQMKKGRPGVLVNVLAPLAATSELRQRLLQETTTLGVRQDTLTRWSLPRTTRSVQTVWGRVRIKVARLPDGAEKITPEFEDCRTLAQQHRVSLREIYAAVLREDARGGLHEGRKN